jgi:predicted RNase H-like HicB family nuclease
MVMAQRNLNSRKVLLFQDEDGYSVVEVPSLLGCISQGKTCEEALENIKEAIDLHIEVLPERREPVPENTIFKFQGKN